MLELESTPDIVAGVAAGRRADQTLVGFAAEHGEGAVERGPREAERKGLDAVVVNDISRTDIGFDSADNEVTIVLAGGSARSAGARRRRSPRRSSTRSSAEAARYRRSRAMSESAYELFKKGSELLEQGDFMAASVPLERARSWSPTRARSARRSAAPTSAPPLRQGRRGVRRGGRALPVNDYAHFCLGRSLEKTGRRGRPAATRRSRPTCARTGRTTRPSATALQTA